MVSITNPEIFTSIVHAATAHTSAMIQDGAIVNADVNANAAIAYSKLGLADSILNADVNTNAAIARTKINMRPLGNVGATNEYSALGTIFLDSPVERSTTTTDYSYVLAIDVYPALAAFGGLTGTTKTCKFCANLWNNTAGSGSKVKLYDNTAAADVTGSEISYTSTGAGDRKTIVSGEITLDETHEYHLKVAAITSGTAFCTYSAILVEAKL